MNRTADAQAGERPERDVRQSRVGHPHFQTFRHSRPSAVLRVAPAPDAGGALRAGANPNRDPQPRAPESPPFTLVGTIIGDENRIAIFYDETSKIASGVRERESASGWTLRSVDPRSAIVEGSGRTVTLDLPEPAAQESPAPRMSGTPRKHRLHDNSDGL